MSNADWWAKQLGNQTPAPVQPRQVNNPMPPSQQPMTQYAPPQPQQPAAKAQSAKQTQSCPECGSGNYMSPSQTIGLRCYDCGYPIVQSGSGLGKGITGGPQAAGPAQPAVQVATGGWNPTTIIGKLG